MSKAFSGNSSKNSSINTLFLDIGGVLLTNGWGHQSRQLAAKTFNVDYDQLEERHQLTFDIYEEGKLTLEQYLERILFYEALPFTMDEFKAFMFSQSQPFREMLTLFALLKKKYALKIVVVNNEGREINDFRIQQFKLNEFVDFFISSCFIHLRKPDPDIFRLAMDVSQVAANKIVYVEDRPMFSAVAADLGINAIVHLDFNTTCKKLAEFGLEV